MKFKLTATIPVVQYGNIMPEYEFEAETLEQAQSLAFAALEKDWARYGERPLPKRGTGDFVEIETFTGEKILYNHETHEYTDHHGNHLVSGSEYAKSFEKPFDTAMLAGKVAAKYKVDPTLIAGAWKHNSRVSTTFGNALHLAMEQYFRFQNVACDEKEYNMPKPAYLRKAVETFPIAGFKTIRPEVIISNTEKKMAGTIDGLHIKDEAQKLCDILDYKSDTDVAKNLPKHFRQLSYYAKILQLAGWSVGGLYVYNYTDKWELHKSEVLEVEV